MSLNSELEKISMIVGLITGCAVIMAGIIKYSGKVLRFIKRKIHEKFPLELNNENGYYYDKKGKIPYCPLCYESARLRAHVKNDRCTKCNKYLKSPTPIVVAVNKSFNKPRFRI